MKFTSLCLAFGIFALSTAPLVVHAENGRITCTDKDKSFVKLIEFRTDTQAVWMDGQVMQQVSINQREIRFAHDLGRAGLWLIQIDRITGVMLIKIPGKDEPGVPTHLAPLNCEKTAKKF